MVRSLRLWGYAPRGCLRNLGRYDKNGSNPCHSDRAIASGVNLKEKKWTSFWRYAPRGCLRNLGRYDKNGSHVVAYATLVGMTSDRLLL